MESAETLKFIVDCNVGRLAKWLRMMGYDTMLFTGDDDSRMVVTALRQERLILTRDTQIMKRGVVTSGRVKAILIDSEEPEHQMRQVIESLKLDCQFRPFTLCLECNQPLREISKETIRDRVPPYVFQTQDAYMGCPVCNRIYWPGTHWQSMKQKLEKLSKG